jgi:hypothetical protein
VHELSRERRLGRTAPQVIQLAPQMKIIVARDPVALRRGIDGLTAVCREQFERNPFSGCLFLYRNRSRTALRIPAFSRDIDMASTRFAARRMDYQQWSSAREKEPVGGRTHKQRIC